MKIGKTIIAMSLLLFFQKLFCQEKQQMEVEKDTTTIETFEDAKQKAQKIINNLLEEKIIPGMAISVTKKGHTIWEEGYGYADIDKKKKVDPKNTVFRIASLSKTISGAGLAKMQEMGIIDWDCSLYDYVKDFPKKDGDFSVKQLSGHIAGVRGYRSKEVFNNKPMTIEQGLSMFKDDPLLFCPGEDYQYNSYDWNLVGVAMEKASGMSFEKFIKKYVLDPIGMKKTTPDIGLVLEDHAVPYTKTNSFKKASQVHNYYKLPSGGYLSTSSDVAKFANAILSHKFLDPKIQQQMLTSMCLFNGKETGYGIGWQASTDWRQRPYNGHIGNGIGGYSWFYMYPQQEVVIVMCFNVTNPKMDESLTKIVDYILQGAECLNIENSAYKQYYTVEEEEQNKEQDF